MRALRIGVVASLLSAVACGGSEGSDPRARAVGATSFEAQPPGGSTRSYAAAQAAGLPAPGAAADETAPDAASTRAIEEADVHRLDGSMLYALNAYRGLQAVDLSDPAAPRLAWRTPVTGQPIDLYLRDGTALVLVGDAFSYVAGADGSVQPRRGSRLLAVSLAGASAGSVLSELPIEGAVEQSRIVGDVLYVVSRRYAWYDWAPGAGAATATGAGAAGSGTGTPASASAIAPVGTVAPGADTVLVASFAVADAAHPSQVARLELSATGWQTHAHVAAERITLSFAGWAADADGAYGQRTEFRVIDVSDPTGKLALAASLSTPGTVQDRWSMDYDGGTRLFRAVSNLGWNQGAALAVWRCPDPATATPLSSLRIPVEETLTAARFDGPRVYLVTAKRTDPLWAVDASDPSRPVVAGSLPMPGQLEFLEPRGDRLVALGHTDEAGGGWRLAVTLLDVTDLSAPRQLGDRVVFGPSWGSVSASADDLRKAFLVFDPPPTGIGLVLVPYQGWDAAAYRFAGAVQLIDYGRDALALRGSLDHPGAIARAFPLTAEGVTLAALSDSALQLVDASDRGAPAELARLDLARSVTTLAVVGDEAVELCGDWYRGAMELAVTGALDPDAAVPLARLDLAAPQARMLRDGDVLWILAHDAAGASWLQGVDVTDPVHPAHRGRLDLAPGETFGYGRWWGFGDEAVLVGHALAVHHGGWPCAEACPAGAVPATAPAAAGVGAAPGSGEIRVYDLSDPDHPRLASTVAPSGAAWAWGLSASGTYLWLTHFAWSAPPDGGRYYLDRIDLADPAHPRLLPQINVPGVFLAAAPDGARIYTLETVSTDAAATTLLHRLAIDSSTARLEASASVDGYPSGAASVGGFAWLVTSAWTGTPGARLAAVDLAAMARTSDQAVSGGWAWLRTAAGGKLFLDAGWQEQGLLVYGLGDPARPRFEQFHRTPGWVSDIVVAEGRAYLPSGPYGVPVIALE
jgi:hypothetical protein